MLLLWPRFSTHSIQQDSEINGMSIWSSHYTCSQKKLLNLPIRARRQPSHIRIQCEFMTALETRIFPCLQCLFLPSSKRAKISNLGSGINQNVWADLAWQAVNQVLCRSSCPKNFCLFGCFLASWPNPCSVMTRSHLASLCSSTVALHTTEVRGEDSLDSWTS